MPEIVKRGPGRPKGARNKVTRDIKELAQPYAPAALKTLTSIMKDSESDAARVAAAKELLDRAYGRSHQTMAATVETTRYVVQMPAPVEKTPDWLNQHKPH